MIKVNLSLPIKNLDGTDIENSSMAKLVAQMLASSNKGPAIKLLHMGINFFKDGEVTVDQSDFDLLRGLVDSNETITILAKGQILQKMDQDKKATEEQPAVPLTKAS